MYCLCSRLRQKKLQAVLQFCKSALGSLAACSFTRTLGHPHRPPAFKRSFLVTRDNANRYHGTVCKTIPAQCSLRFSLNPMPWYVAQYRARTQRGRPAQCNQAYDHTLANMCAWTETARAKLQHAILKNSLHQTDCPPPNKIKQSSQRLMTANHSCPSLLILTPLALFSCGTRVPSSILSSRAGSCR